MDPQELEQLRQKLDELNQSFNGLGSNVTKTGIGLEDILGKKLPASGQAAVEALKGLGKSVSSYNDAMIRGEKGAKVAANSMDELAGGIQSALNVLALFAPGGLLVKGLLVGGGMLIKGVAAYGKAAAKQADTLFKTYKDLSSIGAAGEGLQETFKNLQTIGLSVSEIDQFTFGLKKANKDLLFFGYSMADGAKGFSEAVGGIYKGPLGRDLETLGFTFQDMADAATTYAVTQGRLGRMQMKTQEDLMKETHAYALELDLLARLTGQSREEQEKAQRALIAQEEFVGILEQARAEGRDTKELEAFLRTLPDEMRTGFIQLIGSRGGIAGPEAQKLIQTVPQAYEISQRLLSGQTSVIDARNEALKEAGRFSESTRELRGIPGVLKDFGLRFGGEGGVYDQIRILENIESRIAAGQSPEEALRAEQERSRLTKDAKQSLIDTDRAQRNYQQNLDAFTNKGLKAATIAAEKFATALERGSRALPGSPAGGRATTSGSGSTAADIRAGRGGLGTTSGGYLDKVKQVESGGRNIGALGGASSAFGHYQITKGTFEDLVKNAGPNSPLRGKTFADMQADTSLQAEAARQLTDQNRQFLASRKLPTSDPALYLAHFLGAGGAATVLSASDDTPIQYAVSTKALMANQGVFGNMSTVGDLKAWADRKMGNVGYAAMGGVFSGPPSGYATIMHGMEAVVPLPDGKTIPVSMNMDALIERLERAINRPLSNSGMPDIATNLLGQQLSRLDELINQMRSQVSISTKILQTAR